MATIVGIQRKLDVGKPGELRLWSQRELEPLPWLNCRFYAFVTQLWWAGMRWEGGRQTAKAIAELLRHLSGRPEVAANGKLQGSSSADLDRAVARLLPWIRLRHRRVPDGELLEALSARRWVVGVPVYLPKLPARQQRWSGGNPIGHQVTLAGKPKFLAPRDVTYLDPLGPWGYDGDRVGLAALKPALTHYGSPTFCTIMERGDAMLTSVLPSQVYAPGTATARLTARRYAVFRVRGDGFEALTPVQVSKTATVDVAWVVTVEQKPKRQPQGRFVLLTSGPLAGRYVRFPDVEIAERTAPGVPDAQLKAAEARGRAAAEAEFRTVDVPEPLYERVAG